MGDWQCGVSDNSNRLTHLDYEEVVVKKEDPLEHSEELSTNIVCCETTLKSEDFEYVEDETIKMEVYPEDLKVSLGELPTVVHEDSVDDMDDPQHNSTCVPIKKEDLPSSIKVLNEIKPTESEELDIHYENIKTEKIKEPSESELFFSCEVCKKVFVNKNDLLEHKSDKVDCIALDVDENEWKEDVKLTQGEDLKSSLLGPTTGPAVRRNRKKRRNPPKVKKEKRYHCHQCPKSFAKKFDMVSHARVHGDYRPFECDVCLRGFKVNCNMLKHRKIHEGVRPFHCQSCPKSFPLKSYLRTHEKIHSSEKPFTCRVCSKRFPRKCNLKNHEVIHETGAPVQCKVCSKTFAREALLRLHEQIHVEKFPCGTCSEAFTTNRALLRHREEVHAGDTPFQCRICSKTCTNKYALRQHKKIHNKAKPFECLLCLKSFALKSYLKAHLKTHADKMFQCATCSEQFSRKSCLVRHIFSLHRAEENKISSENRSESSVLSQ